jgi:hypothetical protein
MVQRFLSALNGEAKNRAKSLDLKHYGSCPPVYPMGRSAVSRSYSPNYVAPIGEGLIASQLLK